MSRKVRIFIADDDEKFVLELVTYINALPNMEVINTANNGAEAVKKLLNCKPDIVILDTIMPRIDGLGVLEKMLQRKKCLPICIMLSVIENDKATQKAMQLGAKTYLVKPIEPKIIVSKIRKLVKEIIGKRFTLEERIANIIRQIGIPIRLKGCRYLRDAVILVVNNEKMINEITRLLYPNLARIHHTTPTRVERAIRHAIEVCWNQNEPAILEKVFGPMIAFRSGKPTNSEFIAMLADKVRLENDVFLKK